MISKVTSGILQGQISIFDLDLQTTKENLQSKKSVIQSNNSDKFEKIINQYSAIARRIIKRVHGALLVEIDNKTLYFNSQGINELELINDIALLPADEIIVVNQDKELNELQLKKLDEMNAEKYIKRKGDANIIVPLESKTVVINPFGWVLEYLQDPKYKDDEVYYTKTAAFDLTENMDFKKDDLVEIEYKGIKHKGKVTSVYNTGETINVSWNGGQTAFYYKRVRKVV